VTITYEQARKAVTAHLNTVAWWPAEEIPATGLDGYENELEYLVPFGTKSWLIDGDVGGILLDDTVALVDKVTGGVLLAPRAELGHHPPFSPIEADPAARITP